MATVGRGPRLLVTHKNTAIYLERCRVSVENDRVIYITADDSMTRVYNVPHVNTALIFLGQGTSVTNEAMRKLGEEGVFVSFTGTGGTPLHFGSLTNYQSTNWMRRFLPIYLSEEERLDAAKLIMMQRCKSMEDLCPAVCIDVNIRHPIDELNAAISLFRHRIDVAEDGNQLMSYEADFAKAGYKSLAAASGITSFRRVPGAADRDDFTFGDDDRRIRLANRLIDHGNYMAYGVAGASLWALGVMHNLSVLHGRTTAGGLVFDIADSFKDSVILPVAFSCASGVSKTSEETERQFRAMVIEALHRHEILKRCVDLLTRIVKSSEDRRANALDNTDL